MTDKGPLIVAWKAYKAGQDYQHTRKWALHDSRVDGSLWAAFVAGYSAALRSTDKGQVR